MTIGAPCAMRASKHGLWLKEKPRRVCRSTGLADLHWGVTVSGERRPAIDQRRSSGRRSPSAHETDNMPHSKESPVRAGAGLSVLAVRRPVERWGGEGADEPR